MAADNIFISYSRTDSDFVIKLEEDLKRAGIDIWLDQKKISGGVLWDRAIEEALEISGIMILVISPNSALSENVANEVQYARDEGKIIVPIFIGQTKIPLTWRRYQRIDFIEDYEEGLNNLAQTLKHKMSLKQNNETVKEEQRLKAEAEAEAKQKAEEEKRIKEETEAKRIAEHELRFKKVVEAHRKEEEKEIKQHAESSKKDEELVKEPKKIKTRYIPFIIGIIAVLVIIIWILNSGRNNNRDESYPTYQFENNNYNSETGAWNDAKSNNTIEGFKSFLLNYPDGVFFIEAQKKIDEIIDKNDWESALSINSKVAYQGYLQKHLNGSWASEANQKIANLNKLALQENEKQRKARAIKESTKFAIGQKYQGGIIFYIDATGQHGLIAAPSDQRYRIQWYRTDVATIGTDTSIGTGKRNTDMIVARLGAGNYAAKLCDDLVLEGYDDWFLPSKDELNQIYKNRKLVGGFDNSTPFYWSSSELMNSYAWKQGFKDGTQDTYRKQATLLVRAIRTF